MHSEPAQSSRPLWIGLFVPALLALVACQSGSESGARAPGPGQGGDAEVRDISVIRTTFQANITAPTVVTITPEGLAVGVDRNANVVVAFNIAMTPESASALSVSSAGPGGTTVMPGQASYDAALQQITFNPAEPLPAQTTITVHLGPTLSTQGFECSAMEWTFTTGG